MTLEKRDSRVRFALFPMIHLGAPDFYAEVAQRLRQCDLILTEGVGGRRTSVVTLSYRLAGRIRRFGLVEQRHSLQLRRLGIPFENVDATAAQFGRSWRKAPQYIRLLLLVGAPLSAFGWSFPARVRSSLETWK